MKTNIVKIAMLCIICAATLMAGCIESDNTASIDSMFGSDDTTSKDIVFDIDLILGHHTEPGVMEVELYDDNTAKINTITGSGDAVETGTWQFYRESADHKLYDITTDDTELRVALQNGGHAIAYIYEDHFTKCGEPFYGVWEHLKEESTDDEPTT